MRDNMFVNQLPPDTEKWENCQIRVGNNLVDSVQYECTFRDGSYYRTAAGTLDECRTKRMFYAWFNKIDQGHIVVTRINLSGRPFRDQFNGDKSLPSFEEVSTIVAAEYNDSGRLLWSSHELSGVDIRALDLIRLNRVRPHKVDRSEVGRF